MKKGFMKPFLIFPSIYYLSFLWFSITICVSVSTLKTWWTYDTLYSFVVGAGMHLQEPFSGLSLLQLLRVELLTALRCCPTLRIASIWEAEPRPSVHSLCFLQPKSMIIQKWIWTPGPFLQMQTTLKEFLVDQLQSPSLRLYHRTAPPPA